LANAEILKKISEKNVRIGIIGLGYVGLPLAVTFARNGITVLGFEKNIQKADAVNKAQNYIRDVTYADLHKAV
jgi:UDP-N-acetyl-D-glucosamine dehydrogenase